MIVDVADAFAVKLVPPWATVVLRKDEQTGKRLFYLNISSREKPETEFWAMKKNKSCGLRKMKRRSGNSLLKMTCYSAMTRLVGTVYR